ncbi:hypothetical protein GWK47_055178 [Chionoecetes opilio]|uniref:Uncharacterized protein n=1 Tax=Chionoecetes opilio TaxID=41210 RepID=A0A8J4XZU0_CHIOP|nr:hypothetical protein GWK47_055178 [Chionoecetes opilio]
MELQGAPRHRGSAEAVKDLGLRHLRDETVAEREPHCTPSQVMRREKERMDFPLLTRKPIPGAAADAFMTRSSPGRAVTSQAVKHMSGQASPRSGHPKPREEALEGMLGKPERPLVAALRKTLRPERKARD